MKHYPVYLSVKGQRIALAGGGEAAVAKLRLLLKTEAEIVVYATDPVAEIRDWAAQDKISLVPRALAAGDLSDAFLGPLDARGGNRQPAARE